MPVTPDSSTHPPIVNPRLQTAASAYLRSAAHQPVQWYVWGPEAFAAAAAQDKPILLDIGAVWCHWCHVMDRESYENADVARLINELFIPIKVDRDAQPDVDRRYQEIIGAITGGGGWPLTGFLTPDGQVFYGGTYFPPEARYGRQGLKELLPRLAQLYREQKTGVVQQARELHAQVAQHAAQRVQPGELSPALLAVFRDALRTEFDAEHGGFGRGDGPKFPHTSALALAWQSWAATGETAYRDMVTQTLDAMAAGGIHDHVGGGFHRYTVDNAWHVPHFEKMSYDNAPLLEAYALGYQATGQARYRDVALGIIRFVTEVLSNQRLGGFYAFQDADVSLDDDGSYFTWTREELERALTSEEAALVITHYHVTDLPRELHTLPDRKVLFAPSEQEVTPQLVEALAKLRAVRAQRQAPFVDTTLFAGYNGMMIAAYGAAFQALGDEALLAFAQKSLDRYLAHGYRAGEHLAHALTNDGRDTGTPAVLDDYVFLAKGALDIYELTSEARYLRAAEDLLRLARTRCWDEGAGGFCDRPLELDALGALTHQQKPIQDAPVAGANSVAALALDRLAALTGQSEYRMWADETLRAFAGSAGTYGLFAASYGVALADHLQPPAHVVIVGKTEDSMARQLWLTALSAFRPGKLVWWADPTGRQTLPAAVQPMVDATPPWSLPQVFVCAGAACAAPTKDPGQVRQLVTTFGAGAR